MRSVLLLGLGAALLGVARAADDEARVPPSVPFENTYSSHCFCVSRDGKRLAVNTWDVWDVPSRKLLSSGKTHGAWAMSISPDGKLLAVAGCCSSEFYVYDAANGKVYWDLRFGHGERAIISHLEFTS